MTGPVAPRAAGARVDLDAAPPQVLAWLESRLGGRVVSAVTQTGGMSPGPAARITLEDGARFFVKAVGSALNPVTPRLFRRERAILEQLPRVDYRPALVAAYDDGDWVALVLDDVEGSHPDLDDPDVLAAARETVRRQTRELTPDPLVTDGPDMVRTASRWAREIHASSDDERAVLPPWWHERSVELLARIDRLAHEVATESHCHMDVRDDNLLARPDGTVVVLDWGMARPGPSWLDEVFLDLHAVHRAEFDERVRAIPSYGAAFTADERDRAVTDLVLALGTQLAILGQGDSHGLPHLSAFRRAESLRLLTGAARRLGVG